MMDESLPSSRSVRVQLHNDAFRRLLTLVLEKCVTRRSLEDLLHTIVPLGRTFEVLLCANLVCNRSSLIEAIKYGVKIEPRTY